MQQCFLLTGPIRSNYSSAPPIFNPRRRTATALLKNGLVDYLASDAHRVEHYATYLKALKEAQKY